VVNDLVETIFFSGDRKLRAPRPGLPSPMAGGQVGRKEGQRSWLGADENNARSRRGAGEPSCTEKKRVKS